VREIYMIKKWVLGLMRWLILGLSSERVIWVEKERDYNNR